MTVIFSFVEMTFFFLFSSFLLHPPVFSQDKAYDYLIQGAVIYDGTAPRPYQADVAVSREFIAAIGDLSPADARELIDGRGLVLTPGFIDAHTHSDFNPLIYPGLGNKILQGVTTEITGNCGMSAAPVLGTHGERVAEVWAREGVKIPDPLPWRTVKEYRDALEEQGMETHFALLVGHGNLRSAVMGFSPKPASQSEIEEMKKLLREAMRQGAAGISFGLVYLPGIFAQEEELVQLCREAARHSGVCAFHLRSESSGLLEALAEAVRIGEKAQGRIQISHLKASGKKNWEKIDEAFRVIEEARLRGLRIAADAYPYNASFAELGVILPDSLYQRQDRLALFQDPAKRGELLATLRSYYEKQNTKWDTVALAASPHKKYRRYEGKTFREIVRETGKEPEQLLIEILAGTSFETSAFFFSQSGAVVSRVMSRPYVAAGSDSIADGSSRPHPRAWGSFPKIFREFVREKKEIELGEAVRKMTSLPADHFGLEERGRIEAGFYADLVLFDLDEFADDASYEFPKLPARGVKWVFVNGQPAVRDGKVSGVRNGTFLV